MNNLITPEFFEETIEITVSGNIFYVPVGIIKEHFITSDLMMPEMYKDIHNYEVSQNISIRDMNLLLNVLLTGEDIRTSFDNTGAVVEFLFKYIKEPLDVNLNIMSRFKRTKEVIDEFNEFIMAPSKEKCKEWYHKMICEIVRDSDKMFSKIQSLPCYVNGGSYSLQEKLDSAKLLLIDYIRTFDLDTRTKIYEMNISYDNEIELYKLYCEN